MNEQLLRSRFRELFPKAQNLKKERLDVFVSKLSTKLSEESTQEDVDALWKDYNDVVNFEQLSKDDHRLTSLSLKEKEPKEEIVTKIEGKEIVKETNENESIAQLLKQMSDKIDKLESDKFQESVSSKFKSDKRLEGIPSLIVDKFVPNSFEDIDSTIESLVDTFKDEQIKAKLNSFGRDIPPQGEHSKNVEVKPKTLEDLQKENIKV